MTTGEPVLSDASVMVYHNSRASILLCDFAWIVMQHELQPKNKRRWRLGVSLKMALVLLTAFCLWLGMVVSTARRQERIVRTVEELGGYVEYDYEWDAEVRNEIEWDGNGGLGPAPEPAAPRWLRELVGNHYFCKVVSVHLRGATEVSDEFVGELGGLSELRYLNLIDCPNVTDAGIQQWRASLPLLFLDLTGTCISDAGVAHLSRLNHVEALSLDKTRVSDAGVALLSRMNRLEQLYIRRTDVTSHSLRVLPNIKQLRMLGIDEADLTGEEATRLKEAMPTLRVFHQLE